MGPQRPAHDCHLRCPNNCNYMHQSVSTTTETHLHSGWKPGSTQLLVKILSLLRRFSWVIKNSVYFQFRRRVDLSLSETNLLTWKTVLPNKHSSNILISSSKRSRWMHFWILIHRDHLITLPLIFARKGEAAGHFSPSCDVSQYFCWVDLKASLF